MSFVRAVIILASSSLLIAAAPSSGQTRQFRQTVNCTNISDTLDRCGGLASYSHTMPTSQYPASVDELREACPRHNEGLHCLRSHIKCLRPMTKRAMMSFIESRRKHVKKLCSEPNGQAARDFIDTFSCVRKHKRQKFVQTELKAIQRIEALLSDQVKDFRERFQRSCCSINSYRQHAIEDLGPECSKPHMIAALENAIDSVVGDAMEFACPDPKTICPGWKELELVPVPANKTLTRAGTDLLIVITAPEEGELATTRRG